VSAAPLLAVEDLDVRFAPHGRRGPVVQAVAGASLELHAGEVLALVGESGSGKTTLGRSVLGLQRPTAGRVSLDGVDVAQRPARGPDSVHALVQPVFQDPYSSLDPRWPVRRTIREPLDAQGQGTPAEREARVAELLDQVGLSAAHGDRLPAELSGGQRQRVGIAAALAPRPRLIVADEPVSALDMLVQAQILNLLDDLRRELGIAVLFISHDLGVVRHVADRAAVMYLGRIVEQGPAADVLSRPAHPYAQALLQAYPAPDPSRRVRPPRLAGEMPSPLDPPAGCAFHPRCPVAEPQCAIDRPLPVPMAPGHVAACHVAARHALSQPSSSATPDHP
jgi:oligopeptide/dipeptide ABC transporter ATP-binding protein